MKRTATAVWVGGPRAGEGSLSTASGVFEKVIYTFGTSTIDLPCTNPLEMLAAAEASCMALMVATELAVEGVTPDHIEVRADLTVQPEDHDNWTVPKIHLTVTSRVRDVDAAVFEKTVQRAKQNCPVTRSLKAEITMDAALENTIPAAAVH